MRSSADDLAEADARTRQGVLAFRRLIALGGQLRARMDRRLESSNLTTAQAAVLTVAAGQATPPTQGELASALGVSHQNIRQLMDVLQRKGLLDVRVDPADRRVKRARPTPRVKQLFARRNADDYRAVSAWFADLDDADLATLLRLLESVRATLSRLP